MAITQKQHTKQKCAVFGIAVPYGDFDKKLTRCLNEGICKYKLDFGGAKICTDKEKEAKK